MNLADVLADRLRCSRSLPEADPGFQSECVRSRNTFFLIDAVFMYRTLQPTPSEWSDSGLNALAGVFQNEGVSRPERLLAPIQALSPLDVEELQNSLAARVHRRWLKWKKNDPWPDFAPPEDWFGAQTPQAQQSAKLAALGNGLAEIFLTYHRALPGGAQQHATGAIDFHALRKTVLLFASGLTRMPTGNANEEPGSGAYDLMNGEPNGDAFLTFAEIADVLLSHPPQGFTDESRKIWENIMPALILGIDAYTQSYAGFSAQNKGSGPLRAKGPAVLEEYLQGGRDPRPLPITIDRMLQFIEEKSRPDAPGPRARFYPYRNLYPMWGLLIGKHRMHVEY